MNYDCCYDAFDRYRELINLHDFDILQDQVFSVDFSCKFGPIRYRGLPNVREVFESAWSKLQDELYIMLNPRWRVVRSSVAVVEFDYHWSGTDRDGKIQTGGGQGLNVFENRGSGVRLLFEKLVF